MDATSRTGATGMAATFLLSALLQSAPTDSSHSIVSLPPRLA